MQIGVHCSLDFMNVDFILGVRSVSFNNSLVSIGGGMGHLSFFNLKAGKYLEVDPNVTWLNSGSGWLSKDVTFYTHFNGMDIPNAIYTHTLSPSKTKLFLGGGPLMLGLKGSYGAIYA